MRIKIWASLEPQFPDRGPYKALDIIERDAPYSVGEPTHYGPVISLPPFADNDSDQSVIVQLDPASLNMVPAESVSERPPSSYDKIALFPIHVDRFWFSGDEPPPSGTCSILEAENLTVEYVLRSVRLPPGLAAGGFVGPTLDRFYCQTKLELRGRCVLGHNAVFAIENSADWSMALSDSAIHLRGKKASNQALNGLRGRFTMRLTRRVAVVALLIGALVTARAQAPVPQAPAVQKLATTLRGSGCSAAGIETGDPTKGPSIIVEKFAPGCAIPWHWHTPNEHVMMVSGTFRFEIQGEASVQVNAGDFVLIPSHHTSQTTCVGPDPCVNFLYTDAPADMHFVDENGAEISSDQAAKNYAKTHPRQ